MEKFWGLTELINDGIKPYGDNKIDLVSFQSLILDAQLAKEKIRRKAAMICHNPKVAIVYDQGILDNRAYIDDNIFDEFMKERGITESEILSSYDMVIHLVTAAIGKEEYYTTSNNMARTETIEMAKEQDIKTREAWRNHPNLRVIGNDSLFDEKIEKTKNAIRAYIGEEEVIKKERYLVNINDIHMDKCHYPMVKEEIEEFILKYDNLKNEIFSRSTINGSSYYTRLKTIYNNDGTYVTICKTIRENEYLNKLSELTGIPVKQTRYNFIDHGERYRLNIYLLDEDSFAILERDVVDTNRKELPEFISYGVDVTNNYDYSSDSIYVDYNIKKIYQKKKRTYLN